ncbi:MAG: 50S ribosomal protein L11 methyltransferase [Thermotogaceae bacterium]|nr:50S ribosomal protein L11 methyltransferase [Thermotogaceae bacterium]
MKYTERVYIIESEEALQQLEERLFDMNNFLYAIEYSKGKILFKSYDRKVDEMLEKMGYAPVEENLVDPNEWAKNILDKPFRLIDDIIIDPTGKKENVEEGKILIKIPIGMAFGTGLHQTTKIAAHFLKKVMKEGDSVLDIGTGTAILAILARKLGAKYVLAVDNDPVAIEVAKENVRLNGVDIELRVSDLVSNVQGTFDIAVANIVAPVLERLAESVSIVLKSGSFLILSGIDYNHEEVLDKYRERGFNVIETGREGEWLGAILKL